MTVDLEHPVLGPVRQAGIPFTLSATPASIRTPPPLLGEDTREVLAALGYDAAAIAALAAAGVT
jgi:crotonobetainyl-CoA:carnitine CoA-transferase CaiB-like acyl-CoA transferase